MRVKMRVDVTGTFHNMDAGVRRGDIVDVDEATALRYIHNGIAERVEAGIEESAVLASVAESATVRRRVRQKRPADWHEEGASGWSEGNPQS